MLTKMVGKTIHLEVSFGPRLRNLLAASIVFFAVSELASESVTLSTVYPAPTGAYTSILTTGSTYLARDGGMVGIQTSNPVSLLDVAGGVRIGNDLLCSAAKDGTLRWNTGILQACNGASATWIAVGAAGPTTWSNVIASRLQNVTYINTLPYTIEVAASVQAASGCVLMRALVASQLANRSVAVANASETSISFLVPSGAPYLITTSPCGGGGSGGISSWQEFR